MRQDTKRIKSFIDRWTGKGYEKGQSQIFWIELLQSLFGVEEPSEVISFEDQVKLDHTSFIDAYLPATHVMIEQKSIDKDLRSPIKQSDGTYLNPFQQAKRYASEMSYSDRPRWIVTCNFKSFLIYDMEQPNGEPTEILLENLERDANMLRFLVMQRDERIIREEQLSKEAGELVGRIYDAFLKELGDSPTVQELHSLNVLCVRLVFCLYAEDAGLFDKDQFCNYMKSFRPEQMRRALRDLFQVLDTPVKERDRFLEQNLAAFPYVNGSLFRQQPGEVIPPFTEDMANALLDEAGAGFDWSSISPTIFGAVFESTLNPETRRSGGMHYTSIENIHKVIDPLFLDELTAELDGIFAETVARKRREMALAFQRKLASLKFLDPACGSGNFLTESYMSLRRLENRAIGIIASVDKNGGFLGLDNFDPIKVNIHQFYGIEINDFAVAVATTALWIAEDRMMNETHAVYDFKDDFLPLKSYTNIREGNALRIDWNDVVPAAELNFIMGNPPFVGARLMSEEQKNDLLGIFGPKWKNAGNLDYVSCWYKKCADMIGGTEIRCALVSTNSITQGEQVAILWKPLFGNGIHIDFAYRTFRWDSEASIKAHVHCVIVGFSCVTSDRPKMIFGQNDAIATVASNINPYLIDAPDIFIESRSKPLCEVPEIGIGNKPIDGGNYLFTKEEMEAFIQTEPASAELFHPWYGSDEFINRRPRFCLWLGDTPPSILMKMPHCMERVENVRRYRLDSTSAGTVKLAERPTHFHVENMPKGTSILIPKVSSEKRRYVPMGFMLPDVLCSDLVFLIPNSTLYHFGVLTSNVHMAWMRAVCGRLEMRYRYSKDIVYNNFPWPNPTDVQKAKIESTARSILDARTLYSTSSLAEMYGDTMYLFPELLTAHQANDRAVMEAYGFPVSRDFQESDCVAELFRMYQRLTE